MDNQKTCRAARFADAAAIQMTRPPPYGRWSAALYIVRLDG
jgi:hypothetical protein